MTLFKFRSNERRPDYAGDVCIRPTRRCSRENSCKRILLADIRVARRLAPVLRELRKGVPLVLSSNIYFQFYCLSVLEKAIKNNYPLDPSLQQFLWTSLLSASTRFLGQKLQSVIILLFQSEYPHTWPNFFHELLVLSRQPGAIDAFLGVCNTLHESVVDIYINRTDAEISRNTLIKDNMRIQDVPLLISRWTEILSSGTDLNSSNSVIKLFSNFVSWVDINLLVNSPFLALLDSCLRNPALSVSAIECIDHIISKGMLPDDKLRLLSLVNVPNLISQLSPSVEMDERIAHLLNSTGLELVQMYSTSSDRTSVLATIFAIHPLVVRYVANEYDDTTACLFPYISSLTAMLRKNKTINMDVSGLLVALIEKLAYDADAEFGDDDDGLFQQMRRAIIGILESISNLNTELYVSCMTSFIYNRLNRVQQEPTWQNVDAILFVALNFAPRTKDKQPCTYRPAVIAAIFNANVPLLITRHVSMLYLETLAKYATYIAQEHLQTALLSYLDNRGLRSEMPNVRMRASYLFARFVKNVPISTQFIDEIIANLLPLLVVPARYVTKGVVGSSRVDLQLFECTGYLCGKSARADEMISVI